MTSPVLKQIDKNKQLWYHWCATYASFFDINNEQIRFLWNWMNKYIFVSGHWIECGKFSIIAGQHITEICSTKLRDKIQKKKKKERKGKEKKKRKGKKKARQTLREQHFWSPIHEWTIILTTLHKIEVSMSSTGSKQANNLTTTSYLVHITVNHPSHPISMTYSSVQKLLTWTQK